MPQNIIFSVICCLARRERHDRSISHKKSPECPGIFVQTIVLYFRKNIFAAAHTGHLGFDRSCQIQFAAFNNAANLIAPG